MKTYLLTEDQIERMLACAMDMGYDTAKGIDTHIVTKQVERRLKTPLKSAHKFGIKLFERIKEIEIINEINQN